MIKPNMPNIPGIGAMTDTLDFVKNLWSNMGLPGVNLPGMGIPGMPGMPGMSGGGFNIPGMVMPTLSVEEINKRISDLKAVESWLALNMSMLRGTIQALEVQAATISTLKSMGESFTNTMKPAATSRPEEAAASFSNGSDAAGNSNGADGAGPAPVRRTKSRAPEPTSKDEQDAASLTAPLVNAAAWWNMLQDQFKQAVGTAMTSENEEEKAPAEKKASKPKAKPASGTSAASGTTTRKRKTAK